MIPSKALAKANRALKRYKNLPDEGHVMGVCAGIAYWRGWPTWLVRIAVLIALLSGVGLAAYFLVGLLAPDADATPDDYARRTGDA